MEMFEVVKTMCEKVDVNPALIAYGATSPEASVKAFDQIVMMEEFQGLVSKVAEVGELNFLDE